LIRRSRNRTELSQRTAQGGSSPSPGVAGGADGRRAVKLSSLPAGSPWRHTLTYQGFIACDIAQSGFVAGFGLKRSSIVQLRRFVPEAKFSDLPVEVSSLIEASYAEGLTRGQEIAQFYAGSSMLGPDESLYFAVVDMAGEPGVVCFVHKSP
jgi:hypothetical protein